MTAGECETKMTLEILDEVAFLLRMWIEGNPTLSCGPPEMSGVVEMARGRDWRRFQRYRTNRRKVDILRGIDGDENVRA